MLSTRFGVEIEFTGITRTEAAQVAAEYLHGTLENAGTYYDAKTITAPDGRVWKFMSDGSIHAEKKNGKRKEAINDSAYRVELVTPILTYREDIETLQGLVRVFGKRAASPTTPAGFTFT